MSFVFLMRATRSFVICRSKRCSGSFWIFSWFICSWTLSKAGWSGPTFKTAGRQKKVMQSKTVNCFISRLSSSPASGLTDLIKMNSKSVSKAEGCTALKGSLNFWTFWLILAARGITGILSSVVLVMAFWQTKTGFWSLPQSRMLVVRLTVSSCF